jgi:hypothetical protein
MEQDAAPYVQDFGCCVAFSEMATARKLMIDGFEGRRERTRLQRAPNEDCFGLQIATKHVSEGVFAGKLAIESGIDFLGQHRVCIPFSVRSCAALPFLVYSH